VVEGVLLSNRVKFSDIYFSFSTQICTAIFLAGHPSPQALTRTTLYALPVTCLEYVVSIQMLHYYHVQTTKKQVMMLEGDY
jgi:hypothetical protein